MKMRKMIGWLLLPGVMVGCRSSHNQLDDALAPRVDGDKIILPQGSPQMAALAIARVEPCQGPEIHLNGRLVWDDDVTVRVFTPFAGRVTRILADVGQTVKQDDILAMISSPDFGQAQADARRADSDFRLAERTLQRARELYEHGAAPKKDLEAAEADFARAQSERTRTAQRLVLYGGSADAIDQACPLKSALDGVVVEKNINPGQEVRPDQMLANAPQFFSPLFVVTDPTRLWVLLDVPEKDLSRIRPGEPIAIHTHAFPERVFQGRFEVLTDYLDPSSRTVKLRAAVDNPERLLKAEMFVAVDVQGQHPAGSDVSAKAVFLNGEKHYVFVEEAFGQFSRREIKAGLEHDGKVLVLDGVQPGQRVVTDGCLLLEQLYQSGERSGG
jgi:cobalt-zinc-cadmium efflux system membrane fusion protein